MAVYRRRGWFDGKGAHGAHIQAEGRKEWQEEAGGRGPVGGAGGDTRRNREKTDEGGRGTIGGCVCVRERERKAWDGEGERGPRVWNAKV